MNAQERFFVLNWQHVTRWDLKSARAARFRLHHPNFRPLGDFIEEATDLVRPSDQPEKEWPVYGVNNREGVFFSHHQKGSEFNSAYKRIRQDWFFHNPTRANVGSLGRVPAVPEDALTSPEYQVWRIVRDLLPDYVEVLIRTRFFLELVDFHRVGAVKQRLFVQNLMEIPSPVLTEKEQRKVIGEWQEAQTLLEQAKRQMESSLRKVDDFHRGLR
jgi:type I restriction enzyme S subunit